MPATPTKRNSEDNVARTDDDYYHYYLASQRRVSKWVSHTQQSLTASSVQDDYPDSQLDFGEASSSATSRTRESSSRTPTRKKSMRSARESHGKSRAGTMSMDDDIYGEADDMLGELRVVDGSRSRRHREPPPPVYDVDGDTLVASPAIRYPDVRTRSVIPDNEPTFTEVMGRFGTRKTPFNPDAPSDVLTATHRTDVTGTTRTSPRKSTRSVSGYKPSTSPEFDISWQYAQPIVVILAVAVMVVAILPSAAAVVAIAVVAAVAYCTDLIPDMSPGRPSSSSSSSSRRRSDARSVRSRRSR